MIYYFTKLNESKTTPYHHQTAHPSKDSPHISRMLMMMMMNVMEKAWSVPCCPCICNSVTLSQAYTVSSCESGLDGINIYALYFDMKTRQAWSTNNPFKQKWSERMRTKERQEKSSCFTAVTEEYRRLISTFSARTTVTFKWQIWDKDEKLVSVSLAEA